MSERQVRRFDENFFVACPLKGSKECCGEKHLKMVRLFLGPSKITLERKDGVPVTKDVRIIGETRILTSETLCVWNTYAWANLGSYPGDGDDCFVRDELDETSKWEMAQENIPDRWLDTEIPPDCVYYRR